MTTKMKRTRKKMEAIAEGQMIENDQAIVDPIKTVGSTL
jgi:hypothetical protein